MTSITNVSTNTNVRSTKLSVETCVKAISQSLVMGRKALHTELAVCVSIFAGADKVDAETKQMVVDVYSKAGYNCATADAPHYKTVNRRVNASAALFEKVTGMVIAGWVGELGETKLIEAVGKGLGEYKFDSMDDVLEFVGKDNNRTRVGASKGKTEGAKAAKPKGKAKAEVPMYKFTVEKVKIQLPQTMSAGAMIQLAAKIIKLAREKEQTELRNAMVHPSEAVAPLSIGGPVAVH